MNQQISVGRQDPRSRRRVSSRLLCLSQVMAAGAAEEQIINFRTKFGDCVVITDGCTHPFPVKFYLGAAATRLLSTGALARYERTRAYVESCPVETSRTADEAMEACDAGWTTAYLDG